MTADELADCWWDRWARPDPVSNDAHRSRVRGFGRDFKHREIDSISREEARAWAVAHPGNLRYVRTMFNDALNDGLLETNVFANLRLPRSPGRKDVTPPSVEEVEQLAEAAAIAGPEEHLGEATIFAAYTGLRRGELLALTPDSLLGDHRAYVSEQLTATGKTKPPKHGSEGEVMLPERLWPLEQRLLVKDRDRLFPMSVARFNYVWDKTRKRAQIWSQFRDLRHFHATWLLDRGASAEDVATQLRHNDGGQLVRERYGHPDVGLALGRLEDLAGQ